MAIVALAAARHWASEAVSSWYVSPGLGSSWRLHSWTLQSGVSVGQVGRLVFAGRVGEVARHVRRRGDAAARGAAATERRGDEGRTESGNLLAAA